MTATIVTLDQDTLVTEIDIAAPVERVFKALSDPARLNVWFNGSANCPVKTWDMDARKGGKFRFTSEKGNVVVNGVTEFECHGEILEIDPPWLLVYTWIANWHDDRQRATTVRWELESRGPSTRVKVIHSGLAQEKTAREDYGGGWPGVLDHLKKFSER